MRTLKMSNLQNNLLNLPVSNTFVMTNSVLN